MHPSGQNHTLQSVKRVYWVCKHLLHSGCHILREHVNAELQENEARSEKVFKCQQQSNNSTLRDL